MNKKILSMFLLFLSLFAAAQDAGSAQMADTLRDNGKIYVVITVIGIIFLALVLFLVSIERKVKKLEEEIKNK